MIEYIDNICGNMGQIFYNIKVLVVDNVSMVITIVTILLFLYALFITIYHLLPLLWQFGRAMWKSKVAICANSDRYNEIKNSLKDSYAFQRKKICHFTPNCIDHDVTRYSVIVIDWQSLLIIDEESNQNDNKESESCVIRILKTRKSKETSIIILSLPGKIPNDLMKAISEYSQVTIVNAKGRLANDVFLSLLTTKVRVK